jgi:hypothetical protein
MKSIYRKMLGVFFSKLILKIPLISQLGVLVKYYCEKILFR